MTEVRPNCAASSRVDQCVTASLSGGGSSVAARHANYATKSTTVACDHAYRGRNVVERYDKLVAIFRGAVVLHSIILWLIPSGDMP